MADNAVPQHHNPGHVDTQELTNLLAAESQLEVDVCLDSSLSSSTSLD